MRGECAGARPFDGRDESIWGVAIGGANSAGADERIQGTTEDLGAGVATQEYKREEVSR
jgi:hypothetical protein